MKPTGATKDKLEEVYRRLCITIRRKTDAHAALGRELDKLHAEADELEYQIANYDDDDDDATTNTSAGVRANFSCLLLRRCSSISSHDN